MRKRRSEAAQAGQQETSDSEYVEKNDVSDVSIDSSPARPVKRRRFLKGKQQEAAGTTKRPAKHQGAKKATKKSKGRPVAARAKQYGEASIGDDLREQLAAVKGKSKRPWTQTKYRTQEARYEWFCQHEEDGSERKLPLDPRLTTPDLEAKVTQYMWWVSKNCPGYNNRRKADVMGKSTAKQVHADLKMRYEAQHMGPPKVVMPYPDLLDILEYKTAYEAACAASEPVKGERPDRDPQEGTIDDTMNKDQVVSMLYTMLGSDKSSAHRDMSLATWMTMTIGRGDDARLVHLPDLLKPELIRVLGPCPAFLLTAVLRAGKKQVGSKVAYAGSIRAKEALQCCHGALGRNFVVEFTLERKPFPDPADTELWRHRSPVWMGFDDQHSISYTQQYASQRAYMAEAGVNVRKVTHAWRSHKARDLDEQGVSDDLIARLGRWLRTALNQSYLRFFKPKGLLAAAGFDKSRPEGYFDERFCLDVCEELVDIVFPFLRKLTGQVAKLGKQGKCPESAQGMPALFLYLAVVVVQDACDLLSNEDKDIRAAAKANPVHKYLLQHKVFRDTLQEYRTTLAGGGYEWLRPLSTREEVLQLHAKLDRVTSMLQEQHQDMQQQRKDQLLLLRQRCAPRCLEDVQFEQDLAFEAILAKAAATNTGASDSDSYDEPAASDGLQGTAGPSAQQASAEAREEASAGTASAGAAAAVASQPKHSQAAAVAAQAKHSQAAAASIMQDLPPEVQQHIADLQAQVMVLQQQLHAAPAAPQPQPAAAAAGAVAAAGTGATTTRAPADSPLQQQSPAPADGVAAARRDTHKVLRRSARRQQQQQQPQHEASGLEVEHDGQADDSDPGICSPEGFTRRRQPAASAAAAAAYTGPFQQVLGSRQQPRQHFRSLQPEQPEQPARAWPPEAARHGSSGSAAYQAPFKGLLGKVQPARELSGRRAAAAAAAAAAAVSHNLQAQQLQQQQQTQSIAELAAAAAARAVLATGGDHATVAAAAAQAAAQAATTAVTRPGPAESQGLDSSSNDDADGSSDQQVGRAMPKAGSFKKFEDEQVQQLWQWYVGPYNGGKSVQEMESVGQISWRKQQKYGNQRFRQLNLVLQRVAQLQNEGSRVLSGQLAAAKADKERMDLGMDLPAYIKHLEKQVAAKAPKAAAII